MSRRLVVVMFVDLVGWTELAERTDPELLQRILDDYYALCSDTVRSHGGVVEKFIGDAIMAVFGMPASHESDAEEAVLAARAICAGVTGIEGTTATLRAHAGIAAGEALVLSSSGSSVRVVGDTVNLAARLQSAAGPGQILINDPVRRLLRAEHGLRAAPALTLKGKSALVHAWEVAPDWQAPTETAPDGRGQRFVGRVDERQALWEAHRRGCQTNRTQLVSLTGPPGIGKTQLWQVALDGLPYAAAACSPPGRTGTYDSALSLLQIIKNGDDTRDPSILIPEELSFQITEGLRRFAPDKRPVIVWDDLHWADPKLLELISHVVDRVASLGALVICVGRSGALRALDPTCEVPRHTIDLSPLTDSEIASVTQQYFERSATTGVEVVAQRSEVDLIHHVAAASGGNPLFAELLVEAISLGNGIDPMPFTLIAVIGAALDRLPEGARLLLEQVATAGLDVERSQLDAVGADVDHLPELVDRQLLVSLEQGARIQFAQQLIHDVVYQRARKNDRMEWHLRLADSRPPGDATSAFHLESAARLGLEVRPDAPELSSIRSRAVFEMLRVGTTTLRKRDLPHAISLLTRGVEIAAPDDENLGVMTVRLSDALFASGDISAASRVVSPGERSAGAEHQCAAQALLLAQRNGSHTAEDIEHLRTVTADHFTHCRIDQADALRHLADGRLREAQRCLESARNHASIASDLYEEDRILTALCEVGQWSPQPIAGKLDLCRQVSMRFADDRVLLVPVQVAMARHLMLLRRFAESDSVLATARRTVTDLQLRLSDVLIQQTAALLSSLRGANHEASDLYTSAAGLLEESGHGPSASTLRSLAAREDLRCGDLDAVDDWLAEASERHGSMELRGLLVSAALRLRRAAATGLEIDSPLKEIEELLNRTDDPCLRGDILLDVAQAHHELGRAARSHDFALRALAEYERVGATTLVERVREWLMTT